MDSVGRVPIQRGVRVPQESLIARNQCPVHQVPVRWKCPPSWLFLTRWVNREDSSIGGCRRSGTTAADGGGCNRGGSGVVRLLFLTLVRTQDSKTVIGDHG